MRRRRRPALSRRRIFQPAIEGLEVRITLTVSTWTGGGSNNLWSNPLNWNTPAVPGNDLVFPLSTTTNSDFPANTVFSSITISGGAELAGNAVLLDQGITVSSGVTGTIDVNVSLGNGTVSVVDGGNLVFTGALSTPAGLTKSGAGDLTFEGNSSYSGTTTVNAGRVRLLDNPSISSDVTLNNGSALFGIGSVDSIASNAGVVEPGFNNSGIGQFRTITTTTTILSGSSQFTANLGGTTVGTGGATGYDQLIDTEGALTLNNATLDVGLLSSFTPTPGNQFTIINNAGTTPAVTGTFNNLPEGAHFSVDGFPFRISYKGTSGAGDNDVVLTALNTTTTTLTSNVNPSTFGQPVTFTATVTSSGGTPTGTVNFLDGTTIIGSGTLSSAGAATFSTSTLDVAGSPHAITAVYEGDPNFAASTSAPLSQVITHAGTTTTVTSNLNPSTFRQPLTYTANVTSAAGIPTGFVTFYDSATAIGSGLLSGSAVATFSTSALDVANSPHTITAVYTGGPNFAPSTSAPVSQVVNQASTTTTLTSIFNPSTIGQTVTFTAIVTSGVESPTGTVNFLDGTATIGSGILSGAGVATFSTSTLSVSAHSITAVYKGNGNLAASNSTPLSQVVSPGTTTTLTSSANPSIFGQTVTFTANVTSASGTPTGFVTFYDSSTAIGSGSLRGAGVSTFSTGTLDVVNSPHAITAVYTGDANFAPSTSAPVSQIVNHASTTTTLTSNLNPSTFGHLVTFTATVTSGVGTPTGTVNFLDGTTSIGSGLLIGSGVATFTTSTLSVSSHAIIAVYEGNGNLAASSSVPVSQVVDPFVVNLTGGLDPASDSGISHSDGITNVTEPIFDGTSNAFSTVKVYAQPTGGGGPQQLLGVTVANAAGAWRLQSTVALADGSYTVIAQAVDSSGATLAQTQLLPAGTTGPLIIDTVGPTVTNVVFARHSGSAYVTFQDNLSGLDQATLIDGANYMLNKLVNGKPGQFLSSTITTVAPASPTVPQQVKITFNGGRQIRGGQYLLTILSGGITDVTGNALDGEFYGTFPSGNGTPGGNFSAGLDAMHNTVFAPKPIPNGYASPKNPSGRSTTHSPVRKVPPRQVASRAGSLLHVGTIHNGRLVINKL
jgi:autotransporter-associated beta strand protein